MIVIAMGVVGAGKTTVGSLLAAELGWQFADADDFHPPANVEKIREGIRFVYLKGSAALIAERLHERHGHFAGESILASQLADLEEPQSAIVADIRQTPSQIVASIRKQLALE